MIATAPKIETDRLTLRGIGAHDVEACMDFLTSSRAEYIGRKKDRREAWRTVATLIGHWTLRGYGPWAVADRASNQILGVIGPWCPEGWPEPEMSWSVFAEAEGRGIAREAAIAARAHAYDVLGWKTVVSYIDPENTRSIRLAESLGAVIDPDAAHPDFDGDPCIVYRHPSPEEI